MTTNNYLDKSFGPGGTFAGVTVFILGLFIVLFSYSAIILVLIGAFVGFSSTSTLIDYDKKRVKFSNNIFGIIRIGNWVDIEPDMKLGIKKSDLIWTTYSQTNRILDVADQDYRIVLYNPDYKPLMQIKKAKNLDAAKIELEKIATELGLNLG